MISCTHIYRELNGKADELSKEALELAEGSFISQEIIEGQLREEMYFML